MTFFFHQDRAMILLRTAYNFSDIILVLFFFCFSMTLSIAMDSGCCCCCLLLPNYGGNQNDSVDTRNATISSRTNRTAATSTSRMVATSTSRMAATSTSRMAATSTSRMAATSTSRIATTSTSPMVGIFSRRSRSLSMFANPLRIKRILLQSILQAWKGSLLPMRHSALPCLRNLPNTWRQPQAVMMSALTSILLARLTAPFH